MRSHIGDELVIGIEHGRATSRDRLHDDPLDRGQLPQGVDLLEADVVTGHIQDYRNIIRAVAETFTEDAAAGDFEDGKVDTRVLQHHAGRPWSAGIRLLHEPPIDVDAIRGRHPDVVAETPDDVGDHPGSCGFAVGAGHGDDRDPGRRSLRKHHVDHGLGDVLRIALCRMGVHPESRRGVDLDDRASGFADRLADVRRQKVDAGHVEPDDAGGLLRDLDVVVIGLPGPVDGDAAG